jgi:hypothetical protein
MAPSSPDAEARSTEPSSVAAGSDAVAAQLSAVPAEPGVSAQQPVAAVAERPVAVGAPQQVAAAAVRDAGEEPRQAAEAVVLPGAEAERLPVAASARSAA